MRAHHSNEQQRLVGSLLCLSPEIGGSTLNVLGRKHECQTIKRAVLHGTLRSRRVASEWTRTVAVDGGELAAIGSTLYGGKDVAVGRDAAATKHPTESVLHARASTRDCNCRQGKLCTLLEAARHVGCHAEHLVRLLMAATARHRAPPRTCTTKRLHFSRRQDAKLQRRSISFQSPTRAAPRTSAHATQPRSLPWPCVSDTSNHLKPSEVML